MVNETEKRAGEALLDRQIQTFYQVNQFVSSIRNMDELLGLIMRESEAAVNADSSCIALFDPEDGLLHIEFANGEAGGDVRSLTLEIGQGVLGSVAASRKTLRIDDVALEPRFDSSVDKATGFVTSSLLATPIQCQGRLVRVLEVVNKRGGSRFSENDERLLEIVANQAAIVVENSRLLAETVRSEQLSAVGKMAASIVHDFKGPLSVIRGFAELLANPDITEENRSRFSDMIVEDVDRFLAMSQELLDYSRGAINLNSRPVELTDWLGRFEESFREGPGAGNVVLSTQFGFDGGVEMDPDRVRRVVQNLASNAVDAMPEGGELLLSTGAADGKWWLCVSDNGKGIPVEIRHRVLEPFVTSGEEHGTGLALAIAKEIVEGHGGTLSVESRAEGEVAGQPSGTTFTLEFPLAV